MPAAPDRPPAACPSAMRVHTGHPRSQSSATTVVGGELARRPMRRPAARAVPLARRAANCCGDRGLRRRDRARRWARRGAVPGYPSPAPAPVPCAVADLPTVRSHARRPASPAAVPDRPRAARRGQPPRTPRASGAYVWRGSARRVGCCATHDTCLRQRSGSTSLRSTDEPSPTSATRARRRRDQPQQHVQRRRLA